MKKTLVALVSALALSSGAAVAAEWPGFKTVDIDGNGFVDRVEWRKTESTLKIDPKPTFEAMDNNSNNGVDEDEWAAAAKLTVSYTARCREATASWCKDAK